MAFLDAPSTTGVLFSLFQVKDVEKGKWASLSSEPRKRTFEFFTSNVKQFKDQFFKVLAAEHGFPFFSDKKGHAKFPLFWNRFPKSVLSIEYQSLPLYDQVVLDYLSEHLSSKKKILSCNKLLKWDSKKAKVLKHLSKFL